MMPCIAFRKTYARLLSNDFKIITENTCQWFFNLDGIRIIRMCIFFKSRVQIPICSLSIGYINVLPIDILWDNQGTVQNH